MLTAITSMVPLRKTALMQRDPRCHFREVNITQPRWVGALVLASLCSQPLSHALDALEVLVIVKQGGLGLDGLRSD
jgi:hypothetical protein